VAVGDEHAVMRIGSVRATPVNLPFKAPYRFAYGSTASLTKTIVEVETDDGLVGLGEGADGDTSALIEHLGQRLVGLDPLDLNTCEQRCLPAMSYAPWDNLTALRRAYGAIEIALWDLRGRADHRPLYALLGGAVRKDIRLTEYFSFRYPGAEERGESTALEVARYCARMIEEFDSDGFEGKLGTVDLAEEIRMLRLDINGRFTVATMLELWPRIADQQIRNLEDPVDTLEEMRRLRPHIPCTFSTHNPELRRAIALGVPDSFVCNIVELGGIRRTVEFVRACELTGIGFWFHSQEAAVASAAYLHLSAALEPIREPSQTLFRWLVDDVAEQGLFTPRHGHVQVPEGPGLGIDLDRAALERCHRRFIEEGPFPSGRAGGSHYGGEFSRS
jgi:glucarate dehydratase